MKQGDQYEIISGFPARIEYGALVKISDDGQHIEPASGTTTADEIIQRALSRLRQNPDISEAMERGNAAMTAAWRDAVTFGVGYYKVTSIPIEDVSIVEAMRAGVERANTEINRSLNTPIYGPEAEYTGVPTSIDDPDDEEIIADLSDRLAAMSDENGTLRQQVETLTRQIEQLQPKPEAAPVRNPFTRRHDGRAPDRRGE